MLLEKFLEEKRNEFFTWHEEELSDYDKVYTDIEGNSYCCENCLENGDFFKCIKKVKWN